MTDKNLPATKESLTGQFLQHFGKSLKEYAIRKYDETAFLKSAMIAIVEKPELVEVLKTEQGKLSVYNALRYAATTGLSLNPAEGKSALIGFKGKDGNFKVSYQIMKNGMVDLALESGKVEFLSSDLVRQNDKFELKKSMQGDDYNFIPAMKDRGEVIGFFAALKLKSGATHVKWMTVEEINEMRDSYSATFKYNPENSPWSKSFNGMGLKTVMKALLRNISISPEIDNAVGADDFYETDFKSYGTPETAIKKIEAADEKVVAKKEPDDLL
jgi:phage RecT family recombinase